MRPYVTKLRTRLFTVSTLIGIAFVCGCGSNGGNGGALSTNSLIVSDTQHNRVLIYDAPFSSGQSASVVLGQTDFTTATSGTTASTVSFPGDIAVDNAEGLYVADGQNCRVIRFEPPFKNGMEADLVLGQPNLNLGVCPIIPTANSLGKSIPLGNGVFGVSNVSIAIDSGGNLWAADSINSRVLEFKPPFVNGMDAALAIGQADLVSGSLNEGGTSPSNSSLASPTGLSFDSAGNLWIADSSNCRVLEFKPPFATGMAASLVLGQPDFVHGYPGQCPFTAVAANTLRSPTGIAFDGSGNLWVADTLNSRVLEFEPPFTTNMNASVVVGQVDFTHGAPINATLFNPADVTFDSSGRLFVSDWGNNRVLAFSPPFSNGMSSTLMIGQGGLPLSTSPPTATDLNFPSGLATAPAR